MSEIIRLKQCSKKEKCVHPEKQGDGWLPETLEYFAKDHASLRADCRVCMRVAKGKYRERNREALRVESRTYRADNREKISETQHRYYEVNHANLSQKHAEYRAEHRDSMRKATSDWYRDNKERARVISSRKRARRRGLPNTLASSDWQNAIDYFNGCCAVCGRQLYDLMGTHKPAADHWIPLSSPDCPGTVVGNMLPLCHGENGCNNRKSKRAPLEFLETEFGKRRAKQILARINAYFEWVAQEH